MFSVGDTIGDYEIVAQLRSGGMATLFLGRRAGAAGFAKHVAIKVVHEHLAQDPGFVQMFVDEALLSARIVHPNVVHVEELREVDGRHFLVMEYVYGCSLSQLLHVLSVLKRRLTAELAVHVAIKVADGLHAAHEAQSPTGEPLNVVHRDVTPQNVLMAYQGTVKLIDFGVAKSAGRSKETESGSIKGKFRYMSPEQAHGRVVDRRTDVYALGIVLWEMLAMRQRFDARSDAGILNRVRYPKPIPPSRYGPHVSPELDAVVLKALAADRDERYASIREFRAGLVEAIPKAAGLHESVLGQLLGLVMRDAMSEERERLPESVSATGGLRASLPSEPSNVERALSNLTVSIGPGAGPIADDQTDPGEVPELPTQMLDRSSEMDAVSGEHDLEGVETEIGAAGVVVASELSDSVEELLPERTRLDGSAVSDDNEFDAPTTVELGDGPLAPAMLPEAPPPVYEAGEGFFEGAPAEDSSKPAVVSPAGRDSSSSVPMAVMVLGAVLAASVLVGLGVGLLVVVFGGDDSGDGAQTTLPIAPPTPPVAAHVPPDPDTGPPAAPDAGPPDAGPLEPPPVDNPTRPGTTRTGTTRTGTTRTGTTRTGTTRTGTTRTGTTRRTPTNRRTGARRSTTDRGTRRGLTTDEF